MSKKLFDNITDGEFDALKWILHNEGSLPADYFFLDPTIDGRVEELMKYGFIEPTIADGLKITELGRAALKEYEQTTKRKKNVLIVEWIKFLIPVIISITSLVISIIALNSR